MKKAKIKLIGLMLSVLSFNALSAVCKPALVRQVQHMDNKILIQLEGQTWQVLGMIGDADLGDKVHKVNSAQIQNLNVILTFAGNHLCDSYDETKAAQRVKVVTREEEKVVNAFSITTANKVNG